MTSSGSMVRATFNYGEVEGIALDLLSSLEGAPLHVATVATALMLVKLLHGGEDIGMDKEIKLVEELLDLSGMVLTSNGTVN